MQIKAFIDGLFTHNHNIDRFKLNLRDFLIQLKEFQGADNNELFTEDREKEAADRAAAERESKSKVGGLLKPSELEDDEL